VTTRVDTSGRLLAVDWVPPKPDGRPALVNFVFDGGPLTSSEAHQRISLQPSEMTAWRMAAPQEWDTLLAPHMTRRIGACAAALASGDTATSTTAGSPAQAGNAPGPGGSCAVAEVRRTLALLAPSPEVPPNGC
jgi:hypothetical protein